MRITLLKAHEYLQTMAAVKALIPEPVGGLAYKTSYNHKVLLEFHRGIISPQCDIKINEFMKLPEKERTDNQDKFNQELRKYEIELIIENKDYEDDLPLKLYNLKDIETVPQNVMDRLFELISE